MAVAARQLQKVFGQKLATGQELLQKADGATDFEARPLTSMK